MVVIGVLPHGVGMSKRVLLWLGMNSHPAAHGWYVLVRDIGLCLGAGVVVLQSVPSSLDKPRVSNCFWKGYSQQKEDPDHKPAQED